MFWRRKRKYEASQPGQPEHSGGLTREQALACRPVKCPLVEEELSEELVRLCYPLSLKPWFAQIASRIGVWDNSPRIKRLELDAMGTRAWRLMDGRRSVRQVIDAMAEAYGMQPREAELSVSAFIKDLGRRGLVALHEGQSPQSKKSSGRHSGKRSSKSSNNHKGRKSGA